MRKLLLVFFCFTSTILWAQAPKLMMHSLSDCKPQKVAIDNKGRYLVSNSCGLWKLWDIRTGLLLYKSTLDYYSTINSVEFSQDGQKLITAQDSVIKIWDVVSGEKIKEIYPLKYFNDDKYNHYNHANVSLAKFSEDGLTCVSVSDLSINLPLDDSTPLSKGGRLIGSPISLLQVWDLITGKPLNLFINPDGICRIDCNPLDPDLLLITSYQYSVLYNFRKEKIIKEFLSNLIYTHSTGSFIKSFSKDGSKLIIAHADTLRIIDVLNSNVLSEFKGNSGDMDFISFNESDGRILTKTKDNNIVIWNYYTGKKIYDIKLKHAVKVSCIFNEDDILICSDKKDTLFFYKLTDYDTVLPFASYPDEELLLNFKDKNSKILTKTNNGILRVRSVKSSILQSELLNMFEGPSASVFLKNGKKIILQFDYGTSFEFDVAKAELTNEFILRTKEDFESLTIEEDIVNGKQIFVGEGIDVWDASTQQIQYSIYILKNRMDYVVKLPSGYYKSSRQAAKYLHYVTNELKTIPFEQLDIKYNRPDKVLEAIGSTDTALIRSYRKAYEKRIKKLGVDTTAFRDGYSVPVADFVNRDNINYEQTTGKLKLDIKSADSTYKLDRFNVWVNETPLYGQRGISLRKNNRNTFDSTITIDLSQGENKIETSISNVNGTESYRMPLLVNYTPAVKQKERTYFIGIGIDKFSDSKYDLKYSTKDIRDLSKKLKEKYNDIIIDTLFNDNVTISNVKALKQKLLQTSVNDKVLISYSGHGMLSKDFDYYLSTYAVNFDRPEENGLPYDELESLLDSIPARKKLMLIDACHSGEVDKDDLVALNATDKQLIKGLKPVAYKKEGQLGLKNSFELMQSLFVNVGKSTGATIISAAAGTQFALEGVDNLPNGVFTYCILEAMNKYPTMKISELKKTVGERVVEITKGLQKPTSRNETIAVDWQIW